jgi:lipid-binding SYLF domain-containing protein
MRKFITTAIVALTMTGVAAAQVDAKITERIEKAHEILHSLMATPDKGIPLDIASSAQCVIVVPSFKKGAFIFGGEYGQGVATCRTPKGWSAPVMIQMAGASFGFQIGGQSTDVVLIGRTHKSADDLLHDKVKLGGDVSVAAGPVGRSSTASTTELANAEFLSYSRNKGLFAGIDLAGDEVNQNQKDTSALYGKDIPYQQILSGSVATPPAAVHFEKTVAELFVRGKMNAAK